MFRNYVFLALALWHGQALAFPWYAQGDNIRGAQLMTADERSVYVNRLLNMKTFDECRVFMQGHYLEIDRRAKDRQIPLPPVQGDPCEVMQKMGRVR
jgi:hypothetical protein